MSKAGRRARRERLIEAGEWEPSAILDAMSARQQDGRIRALIADRDAWLRESGTSGWQAEQNRRRARRLARARAAST